MQRKHIGKTFHNLTIIDQIPGKKCVCLCICGNKKTLNTGAVLSGDTKSCGCTRSIYRKNYDEEMKVKLINSIEINKNGCWEWKKSRHKQGYGNFPYKRKVMLAHRVSWMLFKGNLDEKILVCHKCDNPPCCNPEHLFLGTDKDNSIDAFKKGRIVRHKGDNHYHSKIKESDVIEIRKMRKDGIKYIDIAKKFSITDGHACLIAKRKSWKHVP